MYDTTYNKLVINNLISYNKVIFLKIISLQNLVANNVAYRAVFHIQQKVNKGFFLRKKWGQIDHLCLMFIPTSNIKL